ncbi:MotA/TolQ/ExbB proton channel family protein [Rhabdochromatium marinum]|uniref:MotA/TolQ/ExbB proton channel family protein n=1 Tax=Rhabdochromatium marinum TaxID=48729 RepID=UPI00190871B4|nr:MotA/TolQ/ExbB proton channel family protein [Rhabdochromatium marinum]
MNPMPRFSHYVPSVILAILLALAVPLASHAATPDLEQLIEQAKQAQVAARQRQAEREAEFKRQWQVIEAEYRPLKEAVDAQQQVVDTLEARQQDLAAQVEQAHQALRDRLGPYAGLFEVVRQQAAELERQLNDSLVNVEHPHRTEHLARLAQDERLPEPEQLNGLLVTLLEALKAQGEVKTFTAPVIQAAGNDTEVEITRVGPFVALYDGRYLDYQVEDNSLRELGRQPARRYLKAAKAIESAEPGQAITGAIDPSRGAILGLLVQTPNLIERLRQGGLVGYLILGLATVGIVLALLRILQLRLTLARVRRQLKDSDQLQPNNPLGRVLLALQGIQAGSDLELMEHRLDQAILEETPRLNRGLPLLKLLAAIAPLMGLLGTVVGMILTFQAISLYGAGDPKLMAGGISQALVTTVLGLITAIPLLLLHSVANGTRLRTEEILEEQAVALVVKRLEATKVSRS